MKSAISRLNQSGLQLDDEAVRTIQAASRPDWNPHEQLVLVTIPDVSSQAAAVFDGSVPYSQKLRADQPRVNEAPRTFAFPSSGEYLATGSASSAAPVEVATTKPAKTNPAMKLTAPEPAPVVDAQSPAHAAPVVEQLAVPALPPQAKTHSAIVEALVARFAADTSCLIHFCDTDQPQRAAEVCLSVGMEFAERIQRRVLLLDVSHTARALSSLLGVDLAAGFREVLRTELNWRHLVRQTSHPLVDALPAGVIKLSTTATRADFEFQMRRLAVELSAQYGGVFSSADTAFDLESELIGLCCSGGFLTMDFQRTSRGLAKSAANHLRSSGTRLLGCIAAATNKQGT